MQSISFQNSNTWSPSRVVDFNDAYDAIVGPNEPWVGIIQTKPYQSRYDFNDAYEAIVGQNALSRDKFEWSLTKVANFNDAKEATVGLKSLAPIRDIDNWFESRGGRATIIKTKAFTKETDRNNKYT